MCFKPDSLRWTVTSFTRSSSQAVSAGSVMSEWLYDSARKSGDASTLADGTVQYVVVFHDRFRDENPTIDIRHIPSSSGWARS